MGKLYREQKTRHEQHLCQRQRDSRKGKVDKGIEASSVCWQRRQRATLPVKMAGQPGQDALGMGGDPNLYMATSKEIFDCGTVTTAHTGVVDGKAMRQNSFQVGICG